MLIQANYATTHASPSTLTQTNHAEIRCAIPANINIKLESKISTGLNVFKGDKILHFLVLYLYRILPFLRKNFLLAAKETHLFLIWNVY